MPVPLPSHRSRPLRSLRLRPPTVLGGVRIRIASSRSPRCRPLPAKRLRSIPAIAASTTRPASSKRRASPRRPSRIHRAGTNGEARASRRRNRSRRRRSIRLRNSTSIRPIASHPGRCCRAGRHRPQTATARRSSSFDQADPAPGHRSRGRSARRFSTTRRMARRPASSSAAQQAISSRVRRQPTQSALAGSMRQTLMQGDATGDGRTSGLDPDRSSGMAQS